MRTAGLPTFRKLYAKIDTKLLKGEYEVALLGVGLGVGVGLGLGSGPNPHPHPNPNSHPNPKPNPGQVEIFNGRLHPSGALGPSAPGQTLWNYGTGAAQTALFPVHGFGGGQG